MCTRFDRDSVLVAEMAWGNLRIPATDNGQQQQTSVFQNLGPLGMSQAANLDVFNRDDNPICSTLYIGNLGPQVRTVLMSSCHFALTGNM
jgi:hypothetical protein